MKDENGQIIGYHIGSVDGLRRILTNPVYVGWWIYRQTVVSRANHEPVIPAEEHVRYFMASKTKEPKPIQVVPSELGEADKKEGLAYTTIPQKNQQ